MSYAAGASTSPDPDIRMNLPGTNGIDGRVMTAREHARARTSALAAFPRMMKVMLCPVCLTPIVTSAEGIVPRHENSVGTDCPMSGHVGPDWNEDSTREAVPSRSDGWCEYCSRARAQDMAHRRAAGCGGHWSPANILHLCRRCHRKAHDHPNWAHSVGLRLKQGENPERHQVIRENGSTFQPTDEVAMPYPKRLR